MKKKEFSEMLKKEVVNWEIEDEIRRRLCLVEKETILSNEVDYECAFHARIPKNLGLSVEILELEDKFYEMASAHFSGEELKQFIASSFDVKEGLGKGSQLYDLSLYNLLGESVKFSHKKSQITLIDFWATWCNFCQEPMQHNVDFIRSQGESFNKKLRIVAISCDENRDNVVKHIQAKSWDNLEHFVKKNIREELGIKMIPCIAVTDYEGSIVYIGHPKYFNLENDIRSLINESSEHLSSEDNSGIKIANSTNQDKMNLVSLALDYLKEEKLNKIGVVLCLNSEYSFLKGHYTSSMPAFSLFGEVLEYELESCKNLLPLLAEKLGTEQSKFKIDVTTSNLFSDDF